MQFPKWKQKLETARIFGPLFWGDALKLIPNQVDR